MCTRRSFPSLAKSISDGCGMDLEKAFAASRDDAPTPTCQLQLDEGKGTRRDCCLCMSQCLGCDHFLQCSSGPLVPTSFFPLHGVLDCSLGRQGCYGRGKFSHLACLLGSNALTAPGVLLLNWCKNIWDVYLQKLSVVPAAVRERLRAA